ncbi:type III secretion apparatus protein OrgA/MxiK [Escherichia coli]|uniref:type III secretion apparatus protein OrgA/MxiK n=1 Tax=Escherichia coli TaxID=562 RepID=UPI0038B3AC0F
MNIALRRIIYDPLSYINSQRLGVNDISINNSVVRSIANEMILQQYNLTTDNFDLNSSIIHYINNWSLFPLICLLSGCHFYREKFAERGFFYKIPAVLRDYLLVLPVVINETTRYKPGVVNYQNIITCGFSTLLPYIRTQPLAIQQRFNLLFPDFVDHIQLPLPLAPTVLERVIFYAKKNRDELDKISFKWCRD